MMLLKISTLLLHSTDMPCDTRQMQSGFHCQSKSAIAVKNHKSQEDFGKRRGGAKFTDIVSSVEIYTNLFH